MVDTWHSAEKPRKNCLHCADGTHGGHYLCTEAVPCQDCVDDGMSAAEDIAAGYGPDAEDDSPHERDSDLEHPWNMHA